MPIRIVCRTLIAVLIILVAGGQALAENIVRISDAAIQPGESFVLDVEIETNSYLSGWNVILRWTSPDLRCDSAVIDRSNLDPKFISAVPPIDYPRRIVRLNVLENQLRPPPPAPISPGRHHAAWLYFSCPDSARDQFAFVDSAIVRQGQLPEQSSLATPAGLSIVPSFDPGLIRIGSPPALSMTVFPVSLEIDGEEGAIAVERAFEIGSSTGAALDWEASHGKSWLTVSPAFGKTPAEPVVVANLFGLNVGEYSDTIVVSSSLAENSPLRLPVRLRVDSAGSGPPPSAGFGLQQNRPNPFVTYSDPATEIPFNLEEPGNVRIIIYDLLGRRVRQLFDGRAAAGETRVVWDGRDGNGRKVASGQYYYRMVTTKGAETRVMTVIK